MVITFEPLPREFFAPDNPPARLTTFRERWRLLEPMVRMCSASCVLRSACAT